MKKIFTLLFSLMLLAGCGGMNNKMQDLTPGMSKDAVISHLGKPDEYKKNGDYEVLRYTRRARSMGATVKNDYNVILKNGEVIEYGIGDIRESASTPGAYVIYY